MSLCLYLADRTTSNRIHNVLRDIVPGLAFEEVRNDAALRGICLVEADAATHATLAADARVIPLCAAADDLGAALDGQTAGRVRTAFRAQSVADGTLRASLGDLCRRFVTADVESRGRTIDMTGRSVKLGPLVL